MTELIDGAEYLEVGEAATLLGVKKATLYAYVSRGRLRSYRQGVGRRRLYLRADIEALRAVSPGGHAARDDDVLRDVNLPAAESWAGEH